MTNFLISIGVPQSQAGDVALLLVMIVASIALMFIVKKSKIGAFAFAVYASYFITQSLYFDFVKAYTSRIAVFLVIALSLHYGLFKPTVVVKLGSGNVIRWVKRIIISFAVVGFMVTIILGWMPNEIVAEKLSPFAIKMFTTKASQLAWSVAPVLILFAVRKREI